MAANDKNEAFLLVDSPNKEEKPQTQTKKTEPKPHADAQTQTTTTQQKQQAPAAATGNVGVRKPASEMSQSSIIDHLQQQIYAIQFLHQKHSPNGAPARVVFLPVDSSSHCKQAVKFASHHFLKKDDIVVLFFIWEKEEITGVLPDLAFAYGDPLVGYIPPQSKTTGEVKRENLIHFEQAKRFLRKMFKEYIQPEIEILEKQNDSATDATATTTTDATTDKTDSKENSSKDDSKDSSKDNSQDRHHTHDIHTLSLLIPTEKRPSAEHIGKMILENALKIKSDLIIMGARGIGHLQSMLMGSVSEYVVKNAKKKIPVCVVHQ